jgi:hypothetical protein
VRFLNAGSISTLSATLIPLARSSEAILHGLLCVAGSRVTVESGGQAPRPWEIYHRGEAIRLIIAGLSDPIQAISDEMIITIILMCGYDVSVLVRKTNRTQSHRLDRYCLGTMKISRHF